MSDVWSAVNDKEQLFNARHCFLTVVSFSWERWVETLQEATGCPPPWNSRSPWLTSPTSPRLPLRGLMFEPWLTDTHTGRQTYSIQTEMTGVTESKRRSAGTAEQRWQIRREKQSEVTERPICITLSTPRQRQWRLCSLTDSTTLHHPLLPTAATTPNVLF